MDWAKTTARWDEKHFSLGSGATYTRGLMVLLYLRCIADTMKPGPWSLQILLYAYCDILMLPFCGPWPDCPISLDIRSVKGWFLALEPLDEDMLHTLCWWHGSYGGYPAASFTKEVNRRLAKYPLIFNGHLANRWLTFFVKEATGANHIHSWGSWGGRLDFGQFAMPWGACHSICHAVRRLPVNSPCCEALALPEQREPGFANSLGNVWVILAPWISDVKWPWVTRMTTT